MTFILSLLILNGVRVICTTIIDAFSSKKNKDSNNEIVEINTYNDHTNQFNNECVNLNVEQFLLETILGDDE